MPRKKGWSGGKRRDWKRILEDRQFGQRLSDGEEEEREVKQGVVDEGDNNNSVQEVESLTSGLMNTVVNRPSNIEPSQGPSTSTVLAEEAIELAAKTIAPKERKEEKKRKKKKKHAESTSEESSESSSDEEEHVSKRKTKSNKGAKEKLKKKAPIEERKKKFKDQVRKMSSEEIRQHILKMKEKADKLLKKKSFKEFKEDSSAVEERSRGKRRRGEERERKRGKKRSGEEEEESRGMGWWGDQPESGAGEQGEHHLFRGCLFDSHCHLNLVMR